jgi:DNA-binding response OmpR family regulator
MATRVLLVEDNNQVRELCERGLLAEGFEVRAVSSAAAARSQMDFAPTVLITDFGLPDQTGLELARTLQAKYHALLVLIISGHPLEMFHEDQLPLTHGYLEKPFTAKELVDAVRILLNQPTPAEQGKANGEPRRERAEVEWKRIIGPYQDWE